MTPKPANPVPTPGVLLVLVARPGAGKSTLARSWFPPETDPYRIVELDDLRGWLTGDPGNQTADALAVRIRHMIIGSRLKRGLITVVDATNIRPEYRDELLRQARRHKARTVAVVLDVPADVCKARNEGRPHPVPDEVIDRMDYLWIDRKSVPAEGPLDGFDQTVRISVDGDRQVFGDLDVEGAVWLTAPCLI